MRCLIPLLSVFLVLPSVRLGGADPAIAYWDYPETGDSFPLVNCEYALTALGGELNVSPATTVIVTSKIVDLTTDWAEGLRAAGVDEATITALSSHYRADVIEEWIFSAPPGEYLFWARVEDTIGQKSLWALSIDQIVIPAPPPEPPTAPQNLRCLGCP